MQRTDQVVGEAREKLAAKIENAVFAQRLQGKDSITLTASFSQWKEVIAALRAQQERGAEEMRPAIHAWIREDVPLAGKMNLFPEHVDALIAKLRALPLHPAKDEGGGR